MILMQRDMWDYWGVADAVCITTNGWVKSNGENVMGAGCAGEAAKRFPGIAYHLGQAIRKNGHRVQIIPGTTIPFGTPSALVSFPTKIVSLIPRSFADIGEQVLDRYKTQVKVGSNVPGWMCKSTLGMIRFSVEELRQLADENNWETLVLPLPGVNMGGLSKNSVLPIVETLDDRFVVVIK